MCQYKSGIITWSLIHTSSALYVMYFKSTSVESGLSNTYIITTWFSQYLLDCSCILFSLYSCIQVKPSSSTASNVRMLMRSSNLIFLIHWMSQSTAKFGRFLSIRIPLDELVEISLSISWNTSLDHSSTVVQSVSHIGHSQLNHVVVMAPWIQLVWTSIGKVNVCKPEARLHQISLWTISDWDWESSISMSPHSTVSSPCPQWHVLNRHLPGSQLQKLQTRCGECTCSQLVLHDTHIFFPSSSARQFPGYCMASKFQCCLETPDTIQHRIFECVITIIQPMHMNWDNQEIQLENMPLDPHISLSVVLLMRLHVGSRIGPVGSIHEGRKYTCMAWSVLMQLMKVGTVTSWDQMMKHATEQCGGISLQGKFNNVIID